MDFNIVAGDTDKTIYVRLRDSTTGLAKTGLAFNSAGAVCSYVLPGAARAAITLATQTVTGAHSDGGFVEVDATNCKGLYRLDLPDAAIASGDYTLISIEFDGVIEETVLIPLHLDRTNVQSWNSVSLASTNPLPNAAADAPGGLVISDAGGFDIDNRSLAAAAVTNANTVFNTDFATNYDSVNDQWSVSASAVASVTGAVGSVTGAVGSVTGAVGSVTGNVGGNVVGSVANVTGGINTAAGTITTLDALDTAQDTQHGTTQSAIAALNDIDGTGLTVDLNADQTGVTIGAVSGTVGSVTGAVGSVTGNVGGNVVGSVASVTGAVGSVTGNVGGNVVGSVASVTGAINTASGTITTLDGLDTAQDSQHATTQAATTSILAKLLAYFRLLLRGDAAPTTDDATELTAINADAGSGAGDYNPITDSVEAVRDWIGDGSNLTEAGGDGDHLTEAGGTGDQFTAIVWNAAWDAEVQSEVTDALNAYDPPTRAELTTDTNSVLTRLGTPAGASIAADLVTITTDTNELQTDWTNGGRLDLLIDAIKAVTDVIPDAGALTTIDANVDAIKAVTDVLPNSGALTSIAQADTMEGFFQVLCRSDAAIATDRAAILALINANEGTGVGDFANTTDSVEALQAEHDATQASLATAQANLDTITGADGVTIASGTQTFDITGDITGNLSGSVGSVTGNVGGSVANVTGGINTAAGTITTLDGLDTAQDTQHAATLTRLGTPEGASIAADIAALPLLAEIFAGGNFDGQTFGETLKLIGAALYGKAAGMKTTTGTFRAADDSKTRITATIDSAGNRSAVTLDAS